MNKLGLTADGAVVIDRANTHLHPEVAPILMEALSKVQTNSSPFIETVVDFGRVIGKSICVTTGPHDKVIFAQRPNRKGATRFVLDREPEPSTKVMLVLKQTDTPNVYVLITAFIGGKPEVEPWDSRATTEALKFWSNKALVWGEPVIMSSLTGKCPWQHAVN